MRGHWLAIDTATELASVAVGRPPTMQGGAHARGARRHAAEIIRLVDLALSGPGLRPVDLEGIVLADGPGSFTGLRIGWAAAKGLAQETGLELRAVPALLVAAAAAAASVGSVPIAACFDALRGQVYGAMYVVHPDRVETLVAPVVCTVSELAARAPALPAVVVGDGAVRYIDDVIRWTRTPPIPQEQLPPTAAALLDLVFRPGADRPLLDLVAAEPTYGRPAEAQAKWEARHGRPLPDPSRPSR